MLFTLRCLVNGCVLDREPSEKEYHFWSEVRRPWSASEAGVTSHSQPTPGSRLLCCFPAHHKQNHLGEASGRQSWMLSLMQGRTGERNYWPTRNDDVGVTVQNPPRNPHLMAAEPGPSAKSLDWPIRDAGRPPTSLQLANEPVHLGFAGYRRRQTASSQEAMRA